MSRRITGPAPRSWLSDADARDQTKNGWRTSPFGRRDLQAADWKTPTSDAERLDIAAARYHHSAAQALNWAIERSGKSVQDVASEIGMSSDGLYRVLNGSNHMYVTDLVRITTACGRTTAFAFRRQPDGDSTQATAATPTRGPQ